MSAGETRVFRGLGLRMLLAAAAAGVAAWAFTARMENMYRSRALLLLAPMPIGGKQKDVIDVSNYADPSSHANYLRVEIPKPLPVPDYELLLTSEEMGRRLLENLKAAGSPAGNFGLGAIRGALSTRSKLLLQTQDEMEYQRVIELVVQTPDPAISEEVVNAWADLSVTMAGEMRAAATAGAVTYLERHAEEIRGELQAVRESLEAVLRGHDPDALARRLDALHRLDAELAARQSRLSIEAARLEAEAGELERAGADASGALSAKRSEIAANHAEAGAAIRERERLVLTIGPLQAEAALAMRERDTWRGKEEILARRYAEVSAALHAMRLASAEMTPEFKVASRGAMGSPAGPHRMLMILAAMLLGALAAPIHFFGMVSLRRYVRGLEAA